MKHKRGLISIFMASIMLVSLCAVVSSSGVMAADSGGSKTNVQASPTVGAALGSAPAVAVWNDGGINSIWFVRGADGQLYASEHNGGRWHSLGGQTSAAPFAASGGPNQMVVSVRGTNGGLYWKQTGDGGMTWPIVWNKVPTGSILDGTGPAVYSFGANSIGWLVTGTNHQLYWATWNGKSYSSWKNLGGYVKGSPAVVTRGYTVDVYVGGSNGAIFQKSYISGAWLTNFARRDSDVAIADGTSPTASAWGTTRQDLFWKGTDGALHQKTWNQGSPWTAATVVPTTGTTLTSSPSAATGTYGLKILIFVAFRGGNGDLWFKEYHAYGGGTWSDAIDTGTGP